MLLRRIKQHVSNENWFAVFVDFIIVVVGVYVGIEVSNWNEMRQEDKLADEYLERLRDDLAFDQAAAAARQGFWAGIIEFGEAAIAHAETGELYKGSVGQTVLAYFQASQVDPYASVSTTYDELKATGDLRLIRDAELRSQLADYYVYTTSLQAEHLFQFMPRYREDLRGAIPYHVQQYIWRECHRTLSNTQYFIDCDPPVDTEEGHLLLATLAGDEGLVRGLRFWITNLGVANKLIDQNMIVTEKLMERLDRSLDEDK